MANHRMPMTIPESLARGVPSQAAIRVPDGPTVTYEALRMQVASLAGHLQALGIRRADRVAIVLPNGIEAIIAFLAVVSVATAAPLNPSYKVEEFRFYLRDIAATALITGPNEEGEATLACQGSKIIHIRASCSADGLVTFSPETSGKSRPPVPPTPDDVALVLHTSGTTSQPKRVPLTHHNLALSMHNIVKTYNLHSEDISLCIMPLFHVHGLIASTLSTFLSGGTVIVPPRFNALSFWQTIHAHNVTWYSGVPTMHQTLLKRAGKKPGAVGSSQPIPHNLRFIRSCSAPLPATTMVAIEEWLDTPVLEAYGMTEAAHQMASNPLPPGKRIPGSVGLGTGVTIGIMDENGKMQPTGIKGEIVIQGPNVMKAYDENPEANELSFSDGWFRTGDEGILDSDGYLTLVGRIKELINRSGEKISPYEIDEVLLTHPAVAEAVSFGAPHPSHGEEPCAAVVLNTTASQADLVAHCRTRLADFKCPRRIHIVDTIPKTATGKVQRRIVAEACAQLSNKRREQ